MEEASPFSPLPLNPGNAASTEPITAERMARPVDGLAEERGWVAKRGTFSWQGGLLQQCCCREASPSIHTGPCHKQRAAGETNCPWERENTAAKEIKAQQVTQRQPPPK